MFWLVYAITCALLHQVLAAHYQTACTPSWWLPRDPSGYCGLLHRGLQVLGASPLLAAAAVDRAVPRLPALTAA